MIKANVIIGHYKWQKKIKNPNNYFKNKLKKLSSFSYFKKKKYEFSILLTNNKQMKSLNYKFRKKNKPTDLISFQLKNNNFFLELDKMWIHGYFHLIGYDHKKIKDFKKMSKKENLVLKLFHKLN